MKRISKEEIKEYLSKRLSREEIKEYLEKRRVRKQRQKALRAEKKAAKEEKYRNSKFGQVMQKICFWMNRFSLLLHVLLAGVINFIIEALSRHSVAKAWEYLMISPWTFIFNGYMIFATLLIVYIVRRRVFARIIISVVWLILGIVNGYMLSIRVTPFNAQDLKVIDDAVTMLDKYFTGVQGVLIILGILLAACLLVGMLPAIALADTTVPPALSWAA